jgi:hypothetical protein
MKRVEGVDLIKDDAAIALQVRAWWPCMVSCVQSGSGGESWADDGNVAGTGRGLLPK